MNNSQAKREILAVAAVLFLIGVSLILWNYLVDESIYKTPKEIHNAGVEAIKFIGQLLAGLVVMLGVYATWRRMTALERSNEIAEDGQVTDRYVKAVELLGKGNTEEILGGVYALERIAKDYPSQHWMIMEVLTAYVREHAPYLVPEYIAAVDDADNRKPPRNKIVVQSIIDVICRRDVDNDLGSINLSNVDLSHIKFNNLLVDDDTVVDLEIVRLDGANLTGAYFYKCLLEASVFRSCNMTKTTITTSTIKDVDVFLFEGAILKNTLFIKVRFIDVDMTKVKGLTDRMFKECKYSGNTIIPGVYPEPEKEVQSIKGDGN